MKNLTAIVLLLSFASQVLGHGYMVEPAGRNSAWRFGFDTPVNYDDDGIDCGGQRQVKGFNWSVT